MAMLAATSLVALLVGCDAIVSSPYRQQAQDIRRMMEGVRLETEDAMKDSSASQPAHVPLALSGASKDVAFGEDVALDSALMRSADRIERDMEARSVAQPQSATRKRTVLAVQHQESQQDRAARYFAVHGLGKVGEMLGLGASKQLVLKAEAEARSASDASKATLAVTAEETNDDEDDYHKRWAAADALRLKHGLPAA